MFIIIDEKNKNQFLYVPEKSWALFKRLVLNYIEYNSDTSAEHLNKDEDIVRATDIKETVES